MIICTASVIYLGSLYDEQEVIKQEEKERISSSGNSTFDSTDIIKDIKKNMDK